MDKNRHEKENMSKGAARKVIEVESNEENQHEAGGWMGLFGVGQKKRPCQMNDRAFKRIWQLPTLPHCGAVPSAMRGLTSLFGMGRGEHPRQNHHKILNNITYWEVVIRGNLLKKIKAYGQLVLLGFTVTSFRPVAYQRHRL